MVGRGQKLPKWESRSACAVVGVWSRGDVEPMVGFAVRVQRCSSSPPGSSRRPRHLAARNGGQRPQIGADEVNSLTTSAFDLPERLSAKADPTLIGGDEQHF